MKSVNKKECLISTYKQQQQGFHCNQELEYNSNDSWCISFQDFDSLAFLLLYQCYTLKFFVQMLSFSHRLAKHLRHFFQTCSLDVVPQYKQYFCHQLQLHKLYFLQVFLSKYFPASIDLLFHQRIGSLHLYCQVLWRKTKYQHLEKKYVHHVKKCLIFYPNAN